MEILWPCSLQLPARMGLSGLTHFDPIFEQSGKKESATISWFILSPKTHSEEHDTFCTPTLARWGPQGATATPVQSAGRRFPEPG